MKAALLEELGISAKDVPEPTVDKNSIKVKIAYCGICGSDIPRVCQGKAHHYPLILGHEFSGTVVEIGEGVTSFAPGDKVVCAPLVPCMECDVCKRGLYSLCKNYSFIGSRVNGGYAEFVCIPEFNAVVIPNSLTLKTAATIEPCTVARHAFELVNVSGKSVAVIGCGIIGLFAIQWSKILGASRIIAVGRSEQSAIYARQCGADQTLSSSDSLDTVSADVVLDCAGSEQSLNQSLVIAGVRSKIILVGTPRNSVTFPKNSWELINRKETTIIGSWMSYSAPFPGVEWTDTIEKMDCGALKLTEGMIRGIISFDEVADVFRNITSSKKSGRILIKADPTLTE